jgi:hypothetical protein
MLGGAIPPQFFHGATGLAGRCARQLRVDPQDVPRAGHSPTRHDKNTKASLAVKRFCAPVRENLGKTFLENPVFPGILRYTVSY